LKEFRGGRAGRPPLPRMGIPAYSLAAQQGAEGAGFTGIVPVRQHIHAASDVLAAVGALVECAEQLEHEPLAGDVGSATAQLVGHIEQRCRELVGALVKGVAGAESGKCADVAYDNLWTLRLMGKRSEVTRCWIGEAGGMHAVSRVMAMHPSHAKLLKEGSWLVYVLGGVDGLAELLRQSQGSPAVQEAAVWSIYELAMRQRERSQAGVSEWPQADKLVVLLTEALQSSQAPLSLMWACCMTLRLLVERAPCRGTLFVQRGGAEAALSALRAGQSAGSAGESLICAGMQLISALVDGNAGAAEKLRSLGALDTLVNCGLCLPGKVTDETMWTLGQVGGILAVLQVMSRAPPESEAVHGGLAAIAKLTWLPLEDSMLQQFPQALEALLPLIGRIDSQNSEVAERIMQALGGVLHALAPFVQPGGQRTVDEGVAVLISGVGPNNSCLVAQAAVASMGHIAAHAPAWRKPLERALTGIGERMRLTVTSEDDSMVVNAKQQRNLFWASAVIAGLPMVLEEMRKSAQSPQVQDAAVSAIIDILEDNVDGIDQGCSIQPHEVPGAISTVAQAMRAHGMHVRLQWCGCHALGLLHQALPSSEEVPPEALDGVLSSMKRHPSDYKVSCGVCAALRLFLEPRRGRESQAACAVSSQVVGVLRARDVSQSLRLLIQEFAEGDFENKELLEDALYVLGLLDGIPTLLQNLAGSSSGSVWFRSAGLKALFELARTFPSLMSDSRLVAEAQRVAAALGREAESASQAAGLRAGTTSADALELLRRCELVHGLAVTASG